MQKKKLQKGHEVLFFVAAWNDAVFRRQCC